MERFSMSPEHMFTKEKPKTESRFGELYRKHPDLKKTILVLMAFGTTLGATESANAQSKEVEKTSVAQ